MHELDELFFTKKMYLDFAAPVKIRYTIFLISDFIVSMEKFYFTLFLEFLLKFLFDWLID